MLNQSQDCDAKFPARKGSGKTGRRPRGRLGGGLDRDGRDENAAKILRLLPPALLETCCQLHTNNLWPAGLFYSVNEDGQRIQCQKHRQHVVSRQHKHNAVSRTEARCAGTA